MDGAQDAFPLSPAQLGIWYAQALDPQVPITIAQYVDLRGDLDVDLLEQASIDVSTDLGTGFLRIVERDGEPMQYIDRALAQHDKVIRVDLRAEADPEAAAHAWMRAEYSRPLDLLTDRLIRAAVLRLSVDRWFWYTRAHHIALDGFGAVTNLSRVAELYSAAVAGLEPPPSRATELATLVESELAYRDSTRFAADREYWAQRVEGLEEGTSLTGRSAAPAAVNGVVTQALAPECEALLAAAVERHDTSPAALLLAAFAAYLAQWTGSEEVILSLPVTARTTAAMRRSGGTTSNIVPLRLRVGYDTTLAELLKSVAVEVSGALRHQRYRHEDIRRDSAGDGVVTTQFFGPWVNIMLFHDQLTLGEISGQLHVLSTGSIEDLGVNFYQTQGGTRTRIDFETNPNLYTEDEARQHHSRFIEFCSRFLAAPDQQRLWELPLTTNAERARTLVEWNSADHDVPETTLAALLDAQIAATPGNVALDFEGATLTYAEFGARVNRLARLLIADGVGPESLVALGMRRSLELVIAMHAVVKAGGAYVPIDPDHPAERTAYILESAAPVCVLTVSTDGLELPAAVRRVELDRLDVSGFSAAPVTDRDRRDVLRPDNTAYVIYTSGSTGRPKGVAVSHHAIVNQQLWMLHEYGLDASDVYLQKTATTFDVSLWGYFLPLMSGAKLVVAHPDGHRDPLYVADMIEQHGVTVTDFVPSMLTVFVAHATAAQLRTLRAVFVIGEALPPETGAGLRAISTAGLHNLYGPTEAAVSATIRDVTAADVVTVPIGVPEWNVGVYVLDSRLRPVPIGASGELYLSGRQLARGYRGRPDLTSDRFVANPFSGSGERMYRTGDLVRWSASGVLEYIGRTDFQVKFRGQRIELGEIETVLLAHPAVAQAAVFVADTATGQQLVAYVVAAPGNSIDPVALTAFAGERLPGYMVPASVMVLDAFPLNTSGKLDRKALPEPVFAAAAGYRAPRTQAEEVVAGLFADVLRRPLVGIDDNFFELGGNSLIATQLVTRISGAFGIRLGVRALFETPTVAGIAARAEAETADTARPRLAARPRPAQLPLSPAQQRMWFLNRFSVGGAAAAEAAYHMPMALRLSGALDTDAFAAALVDVIDRHETLRTVYPQTATGPVQVILPSGRTTTGLVIADITEDELPQQLRELTGTEFDVTVEVPIQARLFRIAADNHVFAFVVHHIAADGSSVVPFMHDLMTAYLARSTGSAPGWAPLRIGYADYALWQLELLGAESDPDSLVTRQLDYWRTTLAGLPDQLDLATDFPRPARQSLRGGRVGFALDDRLHRALVDLGHAHGATLFMVVHAAFAALLARLSGTSDIAVGTPIAGRGDDQIEPLIGMFVNTLVLRTEVVADESFPALLNRVRGVDLGAFSHAEVPFERLVEVLNPERSTARHPLFQVGLSFQNHDKATLELPGLTATRIDLDDEIAQFDLHLFAFDHYTDEREPAGLDLELGYASELFTAATAERFAAALRMVLESIVAQPDTLIGSIDLLGDRMRRELLHDANRTGHPLVPATLADLVDQQVAATPDAVALLSADGRISLRYSEFDARVNRLARRLLDIGVGPEVPVILALRRSIDLVVAMHAVVKAGGVYVPIDPDHPADRIAYIIDTANPACVLTAADAAAAVSGVSVPLLDVDRLDLSGYASGPVTDAERGAPLRPSNTAYIIFTSGSTGRPKGVAIPHSAIVNQLRWLCTTYDLGSTDRALLKTPATFDLSVWEFWSLLVSGGSLVVTAAGDERDPDRLRELIDTYDVTVLHPVPSLLGMLLAGGKVPASLRAVLAIGEAMPSATAVEFLENSSAATLVNLYGPTETAVSITAFPVTERPAHNVAIGTPAWNSRVYVLDGRLQPVPVGVPGELYLAGAQLARGYFGRAALTADRFVADPFAGAGYLDSDETPDPFDVGARMYRTGDVVRWRGDGVLEYLDRADFQVKIGGFRIELGEIETALRGLSGVTAAVATAHRGGDAGARLVAYAVVPEVFSAGAPAPEARQAAAQRLRDALTRELPAYMVPASIVVLDALPLTVNGKVDRARLPEPEYFQEVYRAPGTVTERLVAQTFAEVVGVDSEQARIGLDTDFFALGGNSLMATRLAARIGAVLGVRVPLASIFEAPTVAGLAERLATAEERDARPVPTRRAGSGPAPLSLAQQRMWVLNRLQPDSSAYHVPAFIRLSGAVDLPVLEAALRDVLGRHDILRTRYPERDGVAVQEVLAPGAVAYDLTPVPVAADRLDAELTDFVNAAFRVTDEVPLRVRLFQPAGSGTDYLLAVVLHHIAADGFSVAPMTKDLMLAYTSRLAGTEPDWEPLAIQYADYSQWQRDWLGDVGDAGSVMAQQLAFWTDELAGAPEQLALPTDRPRPVRREMTGSAVEFELDADLTERLNALARQQGTTLFGIVHTAFAVLLGKLSGQRDITIGVPVAGRGDRVLDELIGMFVNTVVLRTDIDPKATFTELLHRVRDRDLAAFANGDVPFERVVESVLGPRGRASGVSPLFQAMLTFQNIPDSGLALPGVRAQVLEYFPAEAKVDLHLTVLQDYDAHGAVRRLRTHWSYATDIFDAATVELLAQRLRQILATVAGDPAMAIRAIDVRTEDERNRRTVRPAAAERQPANGIPLAELPGLIAAAATAVPEAVAFQLGERSVTYRDLATKITATARAMGAAAKPEALVNIALAGLVPGVISALGAGGLTQALRTLATEARALALRSDSSTGGNL
ncbi:amino acid adenylation domain-containing protein [Nocardia stercoris]|uniref:Amino acid adenylation domain-containing protein n=1 Tax=Nocardia stercoris TaxID=2483361 RepID=A0A3M2KZS6_9NOCA|nr:amino acid adenylation domain-containing protein [Nocardia stercoris]